MNRRELEALGEPDLVMQACAYGFMDVSSRKQTITGTAIGFVLLPTAPILNPWFAFTIQSSTLASLSGYFASASAFIRLFRVKPACGAWSQIFMSN
jgi:hypothetical protein